MDTAEGWDLDWFAVDGDGHVGHFTTAGSGVVPRLVLSEISSADSVLQNPVADAVLTYLRAREPSQALVHDLRGSCAPPTESATGRSTPQHHARATREGPHVVFVETLSLVRAHIDAGLATEVLASEGSAVWYPTLTRAMHTALHRDGTCRSCFWWKADTEYVLAAEHGLYTYDWLQGPGGQGPYGRLAYPKVALRVMDLPGQVRSLVERVLCPSICFAETPHMHPEQYLDCVS